MNSAGAKSTHFCLNWANAAALHAKSDSPRGGISSSLPDPLPPSPLASASYMLSSLVQHSHCLLVHKPFDVRLRVVALRIETNKTGGGHTMMIHHHLNRCKCFFRCRHLTLGPVLTEHHSCVNVAALGRAAPVWASTGCRHTRASATAPGAEHTPSSTPSNRRRTNRESRKTTRRGDPFGPRARRVFRPSRSSTSSSTQHVLLHTTATPGFFLLLLSSFASRHRRSPHSSSHTTLLSRIMQEGPGHTQLRGPVRDRLYAKHMVSDLHLGRHRVAAAHEAA